MGLCNGTHCTSISWKSALSPLYLLYIDPYVDAQVYTAQCACTSLSGTQPSLYSVYVPLRKPAYTLQSVYISTWNPAVSLLCVHLYLEGNHFSTLGTSLGGRQPLFPFTLCTQTSRQSVYSPYLEGIPILTLCTSLPGSQPSLHSASSVMDCISPDWKH
jgi:hypothetical protein